MRLSIPIMLQTGVNSIGFLILQRLINSFGAPSIEGYAAMLKVEQLAHIPSQSFNVAISSFAGQNIGAEKLDRARRRLPHDHPDGCPDQYLHQYRWFCFLTGRFSRSSTSPESPCGAQRNISTS